MTPGARVPTTWVGTLMLATAMALAGSLLGAPSLAATAVQAAMAEFGAARLGVAWSDDRAREARGVVIRRALRGLSLGLAGAGAVYGLGTATGAIVAILPTITGWLLAVQAVGDAIVGAVRDEMLLHGLVIRVVAPRSRAARLAALGACGLASAAWALGEAGDRGLPLGRVAFEALAGASWGALWLLDRGAWLPVAAHAGWRFATRGATFALAATAAHVGWSGGQGGPFAGGSSVVAALAAAAVAVAAVARTSPPREKSASGGALL